MGSSYSFRSVKLFLEINVIRLDFTELSERLDPLFEFLAQDLRLTAEEESFGVVWCHLNDLICDCNDRLVFLHFEFADNQIGETCQFKRLQFLCFRLEVLGLFVFLRKVVSRVSEIEVSVDFLIDFGCFLLVSCLEELSSCPFQPCHICKLLGNGELIEV